MKPNNSTITWNMHKVSLQNYATELLHQKRLKWQGHAHRPRPIGHKHAGLTASPNLAKIFPFCEGKKSSDSLAGICMKQAPKGLGIPYLHSLYASALRRAHHPPHLPHFWVMPKKTYLKWEILQEVVSELGGFTPVLPTLVWSTN